MTDLIVAACCFLGVVMSPNFEDRRGEVYVPAPPDHTVTIAELLEQAEERRKTRDLSVALGIEQIR